MSTSTSSPSISASCNPTDVVLPAGGTGRSTCSITPSATGSYNLTITGSFESLSHGAAITVISYKDQNLADFTLSANPQSLIVEAGHSNSTTLTITSKNNFAGQVDLSSPNPDAVFINSSLNVSAGGNANSVLTIGARSSEQVTATATYQQSITHTVTVSVSVVDFRLAGPASMNCQSGLRCSANLAVTSLDSFSGNVALSMTSPQGLTASLAPDSFSLSANQQVSVGLDLNSTLARDSTVVVTATSGQLSHSISVSVRFTDFSIETSPASVTLLSGSLASSVITLISLNRFWDAVRLSATASVPAISFSFTVTPVALQPDQTANSTLTIEVADTVSGGNYTVTISGTSNGGLLHQATVALRVVTDFAVSIDSPAVTLPVGGSAASKLTIAGSQAFSGSVTLSATSTAYGVELAFDHQVVWLSHGQHAALATLEISTNSSAVVGTFSILITGTSGSQTRNASITLDLTPAPQISAPSSLKAIAGSPVVFMVTATDSDSSKTITLIAIPSTMPPGATFTSASGSGGPVRGVFNWVPMQARDLGEHNITFSVTDGHGGKSSASIIVIVNAVSHPSFPIGAAGWAAIAVGGAGLALLGDLVWKRKIRRSVLLPDDGQ
ncbi:MAG TPA: hypothetical protein VNA15_03230 [Candidatus Angelobacter sp.]|nr:hypothetical protein [Candidatus Angelobacter sp.]